MPQSANTGGNSDEIIYIPEKMKGGRIVNSSKNSINSSSDLAKSLQDVMSSTPSSAGSYRRELHIKDGDREIHFKETKIGWIGSLAMFTVVISVGGSTFALTGRQQSEFPQVFEQMPSKLAVVSSVEDLIISKAIPIYISHLNSDSKSNDITEYSLSTENLSQISSVSSVNNEISSSELDLKLPSQLELEPEIIPEPEPSY
jgi:hypothetical protein